jgi:hypothetical protein
VSTQPGSKDRNTSTGKDCITRQQQLPYCNQTSAKGAGSGERILEINTDKGKPAAGNQLKNKAEPMEI